MPLTREQILERKKLAEKRRRERLKNNEDFKAKNRPLTREQILEKKKLAEKRRRERLKNNEDFKAKNRARYFKRKAEGKILPIYELEPREQETKRAMSRIYARKYYLKKKNQAILKEIIPEPEIKVEITKDNNDPLEENPTPLLLSRADSPVSVASGSSVGFSISGNAPEQRPLSRNSDISEPPSPSSSSSSSLSDTQPQNQTQNVKGTPKRTDSIGCALRRFKYKINKEFQILQNKITELEASNAKYKKQIERMNKTQLKFNPVRASKGGLNRCDAPGRSLRGPYFF